MSIEQESKFHLPNSLVLAEILDLQGQLDTPWHLERNLVYDRQQELTAQGKLLRLRQAAGQTIVTVKGPALASKTYGIKTRQEIECQVASWAKMDQLLQALDYSPRLHYEKYRSIWTLDTAVICLDILPFGHFAEIEGSPAVIKATAIALNLDPALAISSTYHSLHQLWLKEHNLPAVDDILFSDEEKAHLAQLLGCANNEEEPC